MGGFTTWPAYLFGGILILIFCILTTFLDPALKGDCVCIDVEDIKLRWGVFAAAAIFTSGIIAGGILKAREEIA